MNTSYMVERGAEGWTVCEDGAVLHRLDTQSDALQLAGLLAQGAKAAGGQALLSLRAADGSVTSREPDSPEQARPDPASPDPAGPG